MIPLFPSIISNVNELNLEDNHVLLLKTPVCHYLRPEEKSPQRVRHCKCPFSLKITMKICGICGTFVSYYFFDATYCKKYDEILSFCLNDTNNKYKAEYDEILQ